MSRLRFRISMSLDGFVAGPDQSIDNPLGIGGERLHEWVIPLAAWRAPHGLEGGETNDSTPIVEEEVTNIGATIMGRNMFGGHPGPWNADEPWNGWWGANPPFHHPVFVLTHHARDPLEREGGTTFTFVTDGIETALERARRAAGSKDVALAGGAKAARQYLAAGLVDEMQIHLV
ncbi:MAG TPA: dihydrofolate reductase family protein, partial [Sphingomicrobium sp.]|nr:dihydrofolate reductase family protein [Sphingomicrobium sp.]